MGPSKSVLLVDSDNRSLRVLEVSLKKAGFQVQTAETAAGALQSALSAPPDLVVTDTQLPDYDGFELARRLKAEPTTADTLLIFLSQDSSAEAKISAINAGSEFYLTKPVLVRDILSRINELVERQQTESAIAQKDRPGNLSGTLANMGVVDLLQLMESGNKSGIIHLSTDRRRSGGFVSDAQSRGTLFFRDGQVIDARFAQLVGLEAVYRMLLWEDGVFELEFKAVAREDVIRASTQSILLEGMRRVDEWSKFAERVPPLSTRLALDYATLTRAYPQTPEAMQAVLHLFDGRRTLLEVIDDAPMTDVKALEIISELHSQGVLYPADRPPSSVGQQPDVEAWLAASTQHAGPGTGLAQGQPQNGTGPLPSALGDAVIPSPRTPSEILGHQDPRSAQGPMPTPQIVPAGTEQPERRTPSIVLSRHTVAANRAAPPSTTGDVAAKTSGDLQRPTLTLKRVSSVLEMPPVPQPVAARPQPVSPSPGASAEPWNTAPTAPSAQEEITVSDMPSPGLSRPSWDQARAMVNEPVGEGRMPVRSEGFVRGPSGVSSQDLARATSARQDWSPHTQDTLVPGATNQTAETVPGVGWPSAQPAPTEPVVSAPPTQPVDTVPAIPPETVPAVPQPVATAPQLASFPEAGDAPESVAAPATDHGETLQTGAVPAPTTPTPAAPVPQPVESATPAVTPPQTVGSLAASGADVEDDASRDFFAQEAKSEVDIDWEAEGPAWQRRMPGILLAMTFVIVALVLALGGQKREKVETAAAENTPVSEWPKTPESEVVVESQPAAAAAKAPAGPEQPAAPSTESAATPPVAPTADTVAARQLAVPEETKTPEKVKADEPPPVDTAQVKKLIGSGNRALKAERYPSARSRFQKVLKLDPDNAAAHSGLAMVWVNLEKDRRAQSAAWRALKLDRGQARAHLALALVFQNAGERDKAKRYYKSFLKYERTGPMANEVRRILATME